MQSTQLLEKQLEGLANQPQIQNPAFVNPQTGQYNQQNQNLGWGLPQTYSQTQMFAEPNQQNMFAQSPLGLQVQSGNLIFMVLGAILAGAIGGVINRFFPIGGFAPIIGGILLRMVLKSGKGRDFANGVLIGGAASSLSGVVGQFTGGLFGERKTSAPSRVSNGLSPGGSMVRF